MSNNSTAYYYDPYDQPSPTPCWQLKIVGSYCVILFITSISFNSLLLTVFLKYKELRTPLNTLIVTITGLNLFSSLVELPLTMSSNFSCRWIMGKNACIAGAFIMYFAATTNIYLMAFISIERFYVIYFPLNMRDINLKTSILAITFCALNGFLWAFLPLVGWSFYSPEGSLTSCSVEWKQRTTSVISYNITMFVFVYMVPLVVILGTNLKLLLLIKSMPKFETAASQQTGQAKKRLETEKTLTKIIIILVLAFIFSWTPYALVALYSAFINADGLLPILGTLPAMFAKSSQVWTSVIYIMGNKTIKQKVLVFIPIKVGPQQDSATRGGGGGGGQMQMRTVAAAAANQNNTMESSMN